VNLRPGHFFDEQQKSFTGGEHGSLANEGVLMKVRGRIMLLALVLLAAVSQCKKADEDGNDVSDLRGQTVVFVGASITENWDFGHYFPGYNFQKVIHYDWDKTQVWDQVQAPHPGIVLVKECAAYFYTEGGTPLGEFESGIRSMVDRIRGIGAIPVLCTTIPVDVGYGDCTQAQLDDLRAFNDWLRSYCAGQNIVLMDYYQRIADAQGQLPTAYHDGDGLHPNSAGYDVLSPLVIPTLESAL
jgi:hypothetical protein